MEQVAEYILLPPEKTVYFTDALKYRKRTFKSKARALVTLTWIYCTGISGLSPLWYYACSILPTRCFPFPLHHIVLPLTTLGILKLAIFIKLGIISKMFQRKARIPTISSNIKELKKGNIIDVSPGEGDKCLKIHDDVKNIEKEAHGDEKSLKLPKSELSKVISTQQQIASLEMKD